MIQGLLNKENQIIISSYITYKLLNKYNNPPKGKKNKEQSSQIGFLPLEFTLNIDGLSGNENI